MAMDVTQAKALAVEKITAEGWTEDPETHEYVSSDGVRARLAWFPDMTQPRNQEVTVGVSLRTRNNADGTIPAFIPILENL